MTLFITSSPYIEGADRAILNPDNEFVERLKACLPQNPRAVFVCSDPWSRDLTCHWGADTVAAFSLAGMAFSSYAVLDGNNVWQAAQLIQNADLVLFAGGHVPTQNAFLNESGLAELMRRFEGVVMGISAGSMNLAGRVYAQPEEPGESIDPGFQKFLPGLGLTDVNILPHYQKVKDNILDGRRLYEDITFGDSWEETFLALPDGSYVYQDPRELTVLGPCMLIRDGEAAWITGIGGRRDISGL